VLYKPLKPLNEEIEILKIFSAITKVSKMKVPELYQVDFCDDVKAYGRCDYQCGISISITNIGERSINNPKFIETVCHEIVHFNHFNYGHSKLFWEILKDLHEKVKGELCH
jgi:hypothetical protein